MESYEVKVPKLPEDGGIKLKTALIKCGMVCRTIVVNRTLKSLDVHGRPFKPYSPMTLKIKKKKGASTTVNLMDTGKMLQAVTFIVRGNKVTVKMATRGDIAIKHQLGIGVPIREWFGIDKEMKKRCKRIVEKTFKEALNDNKNKNSK